MKSWSWRRAKARPPPRGSAHGSGAPSFWGSQPGRTPAAGGGGARRRGTSCRSGRRRPTRGPAPAASRSLTTPSRTRSRRSTPSSPTPSTKKQEDQMTSGEMADGQSVKSNEEVAKKSKPSKKYKKKTNVSSPLPGEPKPEMDGSDDRNFWVPPVEGRWDDDDGKKRWELSPGKHTLAKNEGGSDAAAGGGDNDGGDENVTAEKDDAESRELASMTKQISSWLQLKQQIRAPVSAASFQSSTKGPKSQQVESLECQQQVITRAGPEILGAQSKT
uniref:Uncharacterized protein n=1 Tax=Zea mays TaxID=4577 RepID=A0A804MEJ1_MAIZE